MRKSKAKIMQDVKNGRNRFGAFVERARRPRPLRRPNSRHGSGSRIQSRPSEHLNSRPASSPTNFRDCQVRKHPDLHLGYPTNPKQDAHSTDFVMRMDREGHPECKGTMQAPGDPAIRSPGAVHVQSFNYLQDPRPKAGQQLSPRTQCHQNRTPSAQAPQASPSSPRSDP